MKLNAMLMTACMSVLVVGCAGRASSIAPMSISSLEYSNLSCDDTRAQLGIARAQENALSREQNNAATADAVGVFLILVPLGSVFGADKEGELAQAKGEALALGRAIPQNCGDQ